MAVEMVVEAVFGVVVVCGTTHHNEPIAARTVSWFDLPRLDRSTPRGSPGFRPLTTSSLPLMATSANPPSASRSELNSWLVEEMLEQYREDPSQLTEHWRDFVAGMEHASAGNGAPAAPAGGVAPVTMDQLDERVLRRASATVTEGGPQPVRIRGVGAVIVRNMEASLGVPTATSVRDVPAKLLEVNRRIANNYLRRTRGGKVSFTHLIAYAMVKAVNTVPAMANTFAEVDGHPAIIRRDTFGLGLAVDVPKDDGTRALMVPVIHDANTLSFQEFLSAYEEMVRKIRSNKLTPDMFAGGAITVTNPGTVGTVSSVPRLMAGQSAILGVGTIAYPAEYAAADEKTLARLGVGKLITLTSTYDHRVIQGAESGVYLKTVHELLLGEDGFYDDVFESIGLPYEPARWRVDVGALDDDQRLEKQMKVDALANMYRVRGHMIADLDPLRLQNISMHPELDPTHYGLSIWDLDREFLVDIAGDIRKMPLSKILGVLRDAYCRTIGVEYGHVLDHEVKSWWRDKLEGVDDTTSEGDQRWILDRLNAAEAFESFLHTKYVGQKRFGLEGAESTIPLLDALCEAAADEPSVTDIVMGMAHRGRLNVLVNIMGKDLKKLFREFEGEVEEDTVQGSGDVKYHLGVTSEYEARSGATVHLTMPPNPSHLETVDPVVEGMARAMQDAADVHDDTGIFPVAPILMHGDAAFAGQGVVAETLQQSLLRGYRTGGTIHVVINNQVGFTTSPDESRSSFYATDVAKTVQAPILHVNGDDPEAVVRVARLAWEYRQRWQSDVVIDMICYRKNGHNEADDPSFTQPEMYAVIDRHRSVRNIFTERLIRRGDISIEQAQGFLEDFESKLNTALEATRLAKPPEAPKAIRPEVESAGPVTHVETGVSREVLDAVAHAQFSVPEGFTRHPRLDRIMKRGEQAYADGSVDWALGEALAFGTILHEGTDVRVAGQDSRRGTFSHRHAQQTDYATGEDYLQLAHMHDKQGGWFIYDSLLSEYAALGFEYGYSTIAKDALVCWEAQFGDFVNGAQIIIDQYIVASEDKWGTTSGLVLLLPHGYEGQGPEHSSARIERFLTLCAEDNIQVVNCTTAAQYFHVLRRQVRRGTYVKPLVIFTPKSLLRSPNSVSTVDELMRGSFQEVIDDPAELDPEQVKTVSLSFGKVAYDLRDGLGEDRDRVAVVRVEQLYPFPADQIAELLRRYPNATDVVWAQEEPQNMGGWGFVDGRLWNILDDLGDGRRVRCVSRIPSASPATGMSVVHQQELDQLIGDLRGGIPS
jgi:2-oxoglutarate decarboxylase